MATYKQIQNYMKARFGFVPKSCWIAHILADNGMTTRQAPNRYHPTVRINPCPSHRRRDLETALRQLGFAITSIPN